MQSPTKHRPSRSLKVLAAVVATTLVSVVVPASVTANWTEGKNVSLRVVNNTSNHTISAAYCPRGHVSTSYKFGSREDPCNRITETHHIGRNGGRFTYTSNPFGVIIRGNGKTLYFYIRNPSVGKPFIEFNGDKVSLVEGEIQTRHHGGTTIRLHREGDHSDLKHMTIEVVSLG